MCLNRVGEWDKCVAVLRSTQSEVWECLLALQHQSQHIAGVDGGVRSITTTTITTAAQQLSPWQLGMNEGTLCIVRSLQVEKHYHYL